MKRADYITIASPTGKGKHIVASRRIGSNEGYRAIAECKSETVANLIVDALNKTGLGVFAASAE